LQICQTCEWYDLSSIWSISNFEDWCRPIAKKIDSNLLDTTCYVRHRIINHLTFFVVATLLYIIGHNWMPSTNRSNLFSVRVVHTWNTLPGEVVNSTFHNQFKYRLNHPYSVEKFSKTLCGLKASSQEWVCATSHWLNYEARRWKVINVSLNIKLVCNSVYASAVNDTSEACSTCADAACIAFSICACAAFSDTHDYRVCWDYINYAIPRCTIIVFYLSVSRVLAYWMYINTHFSLKSCTLTLLWTIPKMFIMFN